MKTAFLEFEQRIAELEAKIEELRFAQDDTATDISSEIQRLQKKSAAVTRDIYGKLTPWQVAQVARHSQRPYTLDYIAALFTEFEELHGDRAFSDDASIVGGLGRFNGQSIMVIGHQKGRDTKEKIYRNFGMPRPEGYRKATRLKTLGLIDKIIGEPLGGAHRDPAATAQNVKKALADALRGLTDKSPGELVEERFERLMGYGKFKELELK